MVDLKMIFKVMGWGIQESCCVRYVVAFAMHSRYAFILSLNRICLIEARKPSVILELLIAFRRYKHIFSKKLVNELPLLERPQHIIDLEKEITPLYSLIYNLSKKELEVL